MATNQSVYLNINGIQKKAIDINYEDLVILYNQFIDKNGRVPLIAEGKLINNLPQQRIIKRILAENNITYNDFINQFGKVKHVRSNISFYNDYVNKFKEICIKENKTLTISDLTNNTYGLPSATWLVRNCPDLTVKTFNDFVIWCGLKTNMTTKDKYYVEKQLKDLQIKLGRPITYKDLNSKNINVSSIVVNRIWGSLSNCKKELGLLKTLPTQPKSFEYYKQNLEEVLDYINKHTAKKIITWADIENVPIIHSEHKTYTRSFTNAGIDIFAFIKSKGFDMNPSLFSFHYTFNDGERVVSSLEYSFSLYLRELGYKYNEDYYRNVMYKSFTLYNKKSRINCDYVLNNKYIEIAGVIQYVNGKWETYNFSSKQENNYRDKLILKKQILEDNNIDYLFLFPEDFYGDEYKEKFKDFIN